MNSACWPYEEMENSVLDVGLAKAKVLACKRSQCAEETDGRGVGGLPLGALWGMPRTPGLL